MAGYPPPYPPSGQPGAPFGYDPRQQREAARQFRDVTKAQIKGQRAAFKAQRTLYKEQARALRRTSILGPLLVIGIGVTLLLLRLGNISTSTFAEFFGHYWPFLFIAAGLILVLEWAFDQYSHQEGVPFIRRGLGGGVVVLLILLAIGGSAIHALHVNRVFNLDGFHIGPDNIAGLLGERHEFEQELDQPFAPGTLLAIDNPSGDVTVVGKSGDDKVHIVVNKQVYYFGIASDSLPDKLSPRISLDGGTLSINVPRLDDASADLSITVPDTGQITINAGHGAINVSNMRAPVNLTAGQGDVELDRIAGPITAHVTDNGSSFSAHSIQGDVQLKGHADDLNLTNISGHVTLDGDFYGDTHMEALAGPVSFHTNRTQFSFAKLDGMVDISSDEELTGSQIIGPTELHTRSRNISLERVQGTVEITNANGTVDVTNAAPLGNISVENRDGSVTLTVPEHAGVSVDAQTHDGGIEDELTHTSIPSTQNATDQGSTGDRSAHITAHTTHADITIHQGFVAPPQAPSPPTPPTPPSLENSTAARSKSTTTKRHPLTTTPTSPTIPTAPTTPTTPTTPTNPST